MTPSSFSPEASSIGDSIPDSFATPPVTDSAAAGQAEALAFAQRVYGERLAPTGERVIDHAQSLTPILAALGADANTQIAALLYGTTDAERAEHPVGDDEIETRFGADVASMVRGTVQLMRMTELARSKKDLRAKDVKSTQRLDEYSEPYKRSRDADKVLQQQSEALRKMLLAMVGDLRVVLVRLASRLRTLRWYAAVKENVDTDLRYRYAQETFELYAPLANRLGIWQVKWELEDLAFRFLEPETYKRIAKMLEEKRVEREAFIVGAIQRLDAVLAHASIKAEVSGRPKHIVSIWTKMKGKGVDFSGLYDVRAFRVIVDDVKDCYTALGLIHNLWQPIPKEFDDYISRPKANGYQSLHTVVVADDGKPFEVQIRTRDMHRFAEYGVAAHWRYKESGNKSLVADNRYDEKIAWIRQLFAWKSEVAQAGDRQAATPEQLEQQFDDAEWAEKLKSATLDDRVYVLTPQARVVDLPVGATPVDFAYHLHTDLGHRCRGAKVDGAMVPLNTPLKTGQTVEIVASKAADAKPSRDWLNANLGYLTSTRAKTKVRAYFNALDLAETMVQGRARIERELQRLGKTSIGLDELAGKLGFGKADELIVAATREEFNFRQIEALFGKPVEADLQALHPSRISKAKADNAKSGVLVVGMGNLLTQLARCCKPAPPDAICGFITRGKGVAVHRADCASFLKLSQDSPERVIDTQWGQADPDNVFPVDVLVFASDRQGLLRDISDVFAREKINVIGVKTQTVKSEARMQFTAEVRDSAVLSKALTVIRDIPGVVNARRR